MYRTSHIYFITTVETVFCCRVVEGSFVDRASVVSVDTTAGLFFDSASLGANCGNNVGENATHLGITGGVTEVVS